MYYNIHITLPVKMFGLGCQKSILYFISQCKIFVQIFSCNRMPNKYHSSLGNFIEACIQRETNFNAEIYFPVLECMETAKEPFTVAKQCLELFVPNAKWSLVSKCATVSIKAYKIVTRQALHFTITQCSGKPLFFPVPVLTNFWPTRRFFRENATDQE